MIETFMFWYLSIGLVLSCGSLWLMRNIPASLLGTIRDGFNVLFFWPYFVQLAMIGFLTPTQKLTPRENLEQVKILLKKYEDLVERSEKQKEQK
jgi:hypothetical protein